jgi:hypothetical protein
MKSLKEIPLLSLLKGDFVKQKMATSLLQLLPFFPLHEKLEGDPSVIPFDS